MSHWAREYFEHGYAQRWGLSGLTDHVRIEAGGIWTLLHLSPGARVVDIGCGHGRHALALASWGAAVIGVDGSAALLNRASDLAQEYGARARWLRGDMRHLPLRAGCADGVVMMDAFGFFDTDDEHDTALREAARILNADGRLIMKIVNGGIVLNDFREMEREERHGVVVSIDNTLATDPPRLTQRIRVSGSRGHGEYERRQRLYRVEEMRATLERAGVCVTSVHATADALPFEPKTSPAMWLVGQHS